MLRMLGVFRPRLSALVGARDTADAALARAAPQGDFVADLEDHFAGRVRVDVLETPVPPGAAGPGCGEFVDRLLDELAEAGLAGREIFLETPVGGDDAEVLRAVAAAGRGHGGPDGAFPRVGAKLRCGGLVPAAFPPVQRVAAVLAMAVELELPVKFTAGLHHPVRHRAASPDVMMHGFLNVFGAGVLAAEAGLAGERLEACLAETEAAAFAFTDDGFAWRDAAVDAAAVGRARARLLPGYGSCSFLEPRDDLAGLGLL